MERRGLLETTQTFRFNTEAPSSPCLSLFENRSPGPRLALWHWPGCPGSLSLGYMGQSKGREPLNQGSLPRVESFHFFSLAPRPGYAGQQADGTCYPHFGPVKLLSHLRLRSHGLYLAYQAPPSMEFSKQEYWSGLPFPSPGDLPDLGIEPSSPTLQADALPTELPGKLFE